LPGVGRDWEKRFRGTLLLKLQRREAAEKKESRRSQLRDYSETFRKKTVTVRKLWGCKPKNSERTGGGARTRRRVTEGEEEA